MGQIRQAESVKIFVGLLSAYPESLAEAEADLVAAFGPVDLRTGLLPHEFTEYYRQEMGGPLTRQFLSFENLVPPQQLPAIKRLTNEIEARAAAGQRWPVARPVNLDPGYVTPAKLVLASTKDYSHRIYLDYGIYAEVTLLYSRARWQELPWTYPDFRTAVYHGFFSQVRDRLLEQRRSTAAPGCAPPRAGVLHEDGGEPAHG